MNELGTTGGYRARGPWSSTLNITVLSFMAIPGFMALHGIRRADTQDFHYGARKQAQEGHEARPKSSSSLLSFPQAVSALEGGAERSAGLRVDTQSHKLPCVRPANTAGAHLHGAPGGPMENIPQMPSLKTHTRATGNWGPELQPFSL